MVQKMQAVEAFLAAVSPKVGDVISCGEGNLYGHPHEETLQRLNAQGASVYRTDNQATVLAELSPKGSYKMEAVAERESIYERIKNNGKTVNLRAVTFFMVRKPI